MKKTLTSLTLSSIAAVAVANSPTKTDPAPLANVNINIPTSGAKPLAKIDPVQSNIGVNDSSKKKSQELDILPLPSIPAAISDSSTKDNKEKENKKIKEEVKKDTKLEKTNIKDNVKAESVSEVKVENKEKESIKDKVVPKVESKTESKADSKLKPNESVSSEIKADKKEVTQKPPISKDIKPVPVSPNHETKKDIGKETKLPVSSNEPKANTTTDLSKNKTSIVGKTVSNDTKDVKTEVTLEKKEVINNIQQVNKEHSGAVESSVPPLVLSPNSEYTKEESPSSENDSKKMDNKNFATQDKLKEEKHKNIVSPPATAPVKKQQSVKKVKVVPKYSNTSKTQKVLSKPSLAVVDIKKTPEAYILSSKDINVDVLHNPTTKEFLVKFENKQGNNFRDSDFANALFAEGKESAETPILFTWLNSKLDNMEIIKSSVNHDGEYLFKLPQSSGKCEAFYVTYKLASDTASLTKSIILDANGNPRSEMDRRCKVPQPAAKEDVAYTKNQYIVSTNWQDTNISVNKPVRFSSLISKEGVDITTNSLRYIIVSEDFSQFYYSVGVTNKSAILGTVFSQPIQSSGTHFFTAIFNNEKEQFEFATSKRYINQ